MAASLARRAPLRFYGAFCAALTLTLLIAGAASGVHPLPAYLLAINAVTLVAYGVDKSLAGTALTRLPETLLQLLALAGGSPAALLAQRGLRHKTAKPRFQRLYWLVVVVQLVALAALWGLHR